MKSRTRLSRSRSIRDAVELISIEWNDGNENTERERERRAYTDSIPKRARQRSLSSFEGARMRARSSDSYQRRATCRIPSASWPEAAASLSEERERGREGEGREQRLIREKKIRFRESTNEAFSFRRRRLMKT